MDCHIERLKAKLAFLDRLDSSHTDFYYQNIDTLKEDIDDALRERQRLNSLLQTVNAIYSRVQKFTNVNGYAIRYLDYGPPGRKILILLHGLGASAERWSHVAPALSRYYRIIIPDIIGFGYSDKPRNVDYTIDFFIDGFFRPFLTNLGISKAISIIGSSFGGHIATEFAIRFNDRVEKLVLVSPAGMIRESTQTLDDYYTAAMYPRYDLVYKAFSEMAYNSATVSEDTVLTL